MRTATGRPWRVLLSALGLVVVSPSAAAADVVWPAYYLAAGLVFTHAVVIGLVVEWPFVRLVTGRSWRGSILPTLFVNLVSALLGGVLIAIAGIVWEVSGGLLVRWLLPGSGTFNPVTWTATAILAVLINSLVEAHVLRVGYSVGNWQRSFRWLAAANSASVALAMLFVYDL